VQQNIAIGLYQYQSAVGCTLNVWPVLHLNIFWFRRMHNYLYMRCHLLNFSADVSGVRLHTSLRVMPVELDGCLSHAYVRHFRYSTEIADRHNSRRLLLFFLRSRARIVREIEKTLELSDSRRWRPWHFSEEGAVHGHWHFPRLRCLVNLGSGYVTLLLHISNAMHFQKYYKIFILIVLRVLFLRVLFWCGVTVCRSS